MITRVLDHAGNVIHDCADMGCEVSWDGYAIVRTGAQLEQGDAVEGRTDPPADLWQTAGSEARQK